ncbi:4-hydroxy-tetrahydrodipicolinate reductase [Propionigenium maris DSM 9537]|uniref:4-hydroxy-tetrahydrodipicolinate reductase n=1 Tax=Propionigenium maris DSM 9537 TaxID=1123000 RepID=A0A9W6LME5_9FUSO|nr:4-hydroxy-tetrahydrodipicolinate reductase [Propionigenium maris]GLI56251.1 4-hydroxy-tetrahydrodipicolinate reductase [Propionigenium maris DSM 9537]
MNIAVYGAGAMGRLVAEGLIEDDRFNFVGMIDKKASGELVYESLESIPQDIEGIIDFSHPSNLEELLTFVKLKEIPLLIATTGFTDEEIGRIEEAAKEAPIIFSYNTSLGVNLLGELVKQMAGALGEGFDIEIIEKHHNKKLDSPSGTAKFLLDRVVEGHPEKLSPVYGREGMARRERTEVGVHAVRGGSIVGEHSVIFAGEDEIVEIKHEALSKKIFVRGALKGIYFLRDMGNNLYTMKDVLGL